MSELADRIKVLKGFNAIDAAPPRVQWKHASAKEPITARIRRRQEAMPTPDEAAQDNERPAEAWVCDRCSAIGNHSATLPELYGGMVWPGTDDAFAGLLCYHRLVCR